MGDYKLLLDAEELVNTAKNENYNDYKKIEQAIRLIKAYNNNNLKNNLKLIRQLGENTTIGQLKNQLKNGEVELNPAQEKWLEIMQQIRIAKQTVCQRNSENIANHKPKQHPDFPDDDGNRGF